MARLYLLSLIDPFGTLWFIYLLPVFFVVIKLTRRVPVPVIWLAGAALEQALDAHHVAAGVEQHALRLEAIASSAPGFLLVVLE